MFKRLLCDRAIYVNYKLVDEPIIKEYPKGTIFYGNDLEYDISMFRVYLEDGNGEIFINNDAVYFEDIKRSDPSFDFSMIIGD